PSHCRVTPTSRSTASGTSSTCAASAARSTSPRSPSESLQNQLTLLALLAIAFTAYSLTPCQDFCQGTVLGFTPWCWCNENFLKFNRTCFQKCVTNCKAKSDYTKCIPSNGIPTTTLWLCCMNKITWTTYLKCDGECWSTALP
ncbi:hypothetical protein PMAYCL1PPCAC_03708, partial [Pristionchus mayeri]